MRCCGSAHVPVAPPPLQICTPMSCPAEFVASSRTDIPPARDVQLCTLEWQPPPPAASVAAPPSASTVSTGGEVGGPPPLLPHATALRTIRDRTALFMGRA